MQVSLPRWPSTKAVNFNSINAFVWFILGSVNYSLHVTKIATTSSLPALQCHHDDRVERLRDDAVLVHVAEDLRERWERKTSTTDDLKHFFPQEITRKSRCWCAKTLNDAHRDHRNWCRKLWRFQSEICGVAIPANTSKAQLTCK